MDAIPTSLNVLSFIDVFFQNFLRFYLQVTPAMHLEHCLLYLIQHFWVFEVGKFPVDLVCGVPRQQIILSRDLHSSLHPSPRYMEQHAHHYISLTLSHLQSLRLKKVTQCNSESL